MKLEIYNNATDAWVDITPYIAWQGLTFSRNDVDSPNAGRDMSGTMHRGRVGIKEKMNVKTVPLKNDECNMIYQLLYPETIYVRVNPHPETNGSKTMYMYSNNVSTSFVGNVGGVETKSMSFPLIEN